MDEFTETTVMPILCAGIMEYLKPGKSLVLRKSEILAKPDTETHAVRIDSRHEDYYVLRVVPITAAMRRQLMGVTEEALRAQLPEGATISVNHYRDVEGMVEDPRYDIESPSRYHAAFGLYPAHIARRNRLTIHPQGGFTLVQIEGPSGERSTGLSVCSPKDNFCRYEGRLLAFERAVKAFSVGLHIPKEQVLRVVLSENERANPRAIEDLARMARAFEPQDIRPAE